MAEWTINEDMIIEEWGDSEIHWQQKNREIINEAIRAYNLYITGVEENLDKVIMLIMYAEMRLVDEPGDYIKDISLMKSNLDKFEESKK